MRSSLQAGARLLSKGLRTSSPAHAGLGAALIAIALVRAGEAKEVPARYRTRLRPGEELRIIVHSAEAAPSESSG